MNYLFKEKQKFTQWWLWAILLVFPILSIYPFDNNGINYDYVLIGIALPLGFYFLELRTFVSKEGLHYRFFPFHFKEYVIKHEDIESFKAMEYSPLKEYGGWGIRYGFKGKAYNTSGNKGVKVFLKNGKNIMFGSLKHKELERALKEVRK